MATNIRYISIAASDSPKRPSTYKKYSHKHKALHICDHEAMQASRTQPQGAPLPRIGLQSHFEQSRLLGDQLHLARVPPTSKTVFPPAIFG